MGFSGTTFLANLLNHAPDVEARHEFFGDSVFMTLSYYQPSHPYLELRLRQQREQVLARFPRLHTFVDVNQCLRFSLDTVRRTLDDPLCFHLVRNGRDVVRSLYLSKMYTKGARRVWLVPTDSATLELWRGYSQFERLCWNWNEAVNRLLEEEVNVLHLERTVSDYQYLRERLLEPSGIHLEPDVWHALKDKSLHRTRFRLKKLWRGYPIRLKWTPKHEASFMSICGETMRALGYE